MGNTECCDRSSLQPVNGFSQSPIISPRSYIKKNESKLKKLPSIEEVSNQPNNASDVASKKQEDINKQHEGLNNIQQNQNITPFSFTAKEVISQKLLLTIDEVWVANMRLGGYDILEIYERIDDEVRRTTTAEHNKVQLLFNEDIPKLGWSQFTVSLLSYMPSEGYEFVLGVIDSITGRQKLHSWMLPCQQGYNFSEQKQLDVVDVKNKEVECNLKLALAISRQEGKIRYYRDSILVKQQTIRPQVLQNSGKIVPYVQTFKRGVQFYWQRPLKKTTTLKNIVAIPEESSNVSIASVSALVS